MEERAEYKVSGERIRLPRSVLLEYADPERTDPEPEHVREVLKRGLLTGARAAKLLGVSGRTVRKWTGGDQRISFAAWQVLLHYIREIDLPRLDTDGPAGAAAFAPGQEPLTALDSCVTKDAG